MKWLFEFLLLQEKKIVKSGSHIFGNCSTSQSEEVAQYHRSGQCSVIKREQKNKIIALKLLNFYTSKKQDYSMKA